MQFDRFRTRRVTPLGLFEHQGWRLKTYGIGVGETIPREELQRIAPILARERLPLPAITESRYGVGWIMVHEGLAGDYVFVDWWTEQDVAQHHLYGAPHLTTPLTYGWPEGAGFCVWEMAVCWHERGAWIGHVLDRPDQPDFEGYLADWLSGPV
jgi:hypothetical protein